MTGQSAAVLQTITSSWMQRRGHTAPGLLSKKQKQDVQDCFALLDTDRTGRLSVDNLLSAFQLSNIEAHDHEVRELIAAMDKQGTSFITFDSFETVMARSMVQQQAAAVQPADLSTTVRLQPESSGLPFHEIARTFRRKRMMAEVMGGGKGRQEILNRHADRHLNDETEGRTMMAMKMHLQIQQAKQACTRPRLRHESPRVQQPRKPPVPTIRLGSLARKLPQDLQLAVADAAAYDPPASGDSSTRLPGSSPHGTPSDPQLGQSVFHLAQAVQQVKKSQESLFPQNNLGGSQQSSQQSTQQSTQRSSQQSSQHISQQSSQQSSQSMSHPPRRLSSNKQSQPCLRQIGFPTLPVNHMGSNQSAPTQRDRTWQQVSVMTPRQLAVEQLLSHKLHGLASQQASVRPHSVETSAVSAGSPKPDPSAGQSADLTGAPSIALSGGVQGPLVAKPSKAHAWASKHAAEAVEPSVEVGDDGLPLGVFERHSLSPRKTAEIPSHQQHLDSWRLTELRTFRRQQAQLEQEAEERSAAAKCNGAKLQSTDCAGGEERGRGVAAAAGPAAVQLQRKLTVDHMIADSATANSAESAVQGLFSVHQLPSKRPRKRPSMHRVHCPALPAWTQHDSRGPAFSIPTAIDKMKDETSMAPRRALAGSCNPGGKQGLEENLWAGIGGFGRNGRCRDASSTAALQTPRIKFSLQMPQLSARVSLPSMATRLWQGIQNHSPGDVRCVCGSAGSLNAAALLTLAGRRCGPHLNLTRANEGKAG